MSLTNLFGLKISRDCRVQQKRFEGLFILKITFIIFCECHPLHIFFNLLVNLKIFSILKTNHTNKSIIDLEKKHFPVVWAHS